MMPEEVRKLVLESMPLAAVEVRDMTGTGDHFEIHVASASFQGLSLMEQHRAIFKILEPQMGLGMGIHAVQLKTKAI